MQKIEGYVDNFAGTPSPSSSKALYTSGGTSGVTGGSYGSYYRINIDTSRTCRTSSITRGKSKGVKYIIKAL